MIENLAVGGEFAVELVLNGIPRRVEEYKAIMQFTGLHDKNGKDIYEGDLIKNSIDEVEEVIWSEYLGAWQMRNGKNPDDSLAYFLREEPFEVIGNIYENPTLLNK